jgi:hypothetical protein
MQYSGSETTSSLPPVSTPFSCPNVPIAQTTSIAVKCTRAAHDDNPPFRVSEASNFLAADHDEDYEGGSEPDQNACDRAVARGRSPAKSSFELTSLPLCRGFFSAN